ncbi:MAG: DUF547 domain-containing protein [Syntrophobacterales bacterium]|nr:MAG: DUF547 domain-containing protein [Syntrophobacterales bacterium]
MSRIFTDYVEKAKKILEDNWSGSSTKPSSALYPHQWNWDSGFIAIGRAHYDTERAIEEIETLFEAQWSNGMLPQIVFNPDELGHYFPEPDFWQTERSPHAPTGKLTSGITMPPVHAIAVEKIYHHARRPRKVLPFLKKIYPKLLDLHAYLYRERDPAGEGLVYIRHPWESGIDNSPTWDFPLRKIKIDTASLPHYTRMDLKHVADPSMRPSDEDYDRYVYLVDLFRQCNYDEATIRKTCPFLIQDPLFNTILARANESLVRIAEIIGESPDVPREWAEKTVNAIRTKLWHEEHDMFDAFDLVTDELIEVDTAAGFLPLWAGAPSRDQARRLYERLNSSSFCALHQGNCFTIPNYDTKKEEYDRANYWRGPVWININWMIAQGLRRYGYTLKADSIQKDLLQLPIRFGFYEYFDSSDGSGYGSDNFSWTAALFIDLVNEFYGQDTTSAGIGSGLRAFFVEETVLNDGDEMPDCGIQNLSGELMHSIRALKDRFYNTERGLVDYEQLKDSPEYRSYRILTNGLRQFDPEMIMGRKEKIAFWINLYNTIVVDAIVTLGITASVQEVPGFFRNVKYRIGNYIFSADDIEHGILRSNARPLFSPFRPFRPRDPRKAFILFPVDPRIHFALVCGSRSCAPIDYYDAETIYDQLEVAAKSFVNSSEVLILPEEKKILMSEIFRWYEKDFGGLRGIKDFLTDYLVDSKAKAFIRDNYSGLNFEYLHYDWNLNR